MHSHALQRVDNEYHTQTYRALARKEKGLKPLKLGKSSLPRAEARGYGY